MKTIERIQNVGERGQITLPALWRKKTRASSVVVREKDGVLTVLPFRTEDEREESWVTVFDAMRDTKGKGVPVGIFIKELEKSL